MKLGRRLRFPWRRLPLFPEPPDFRFGVATADHQCEAYEAGTEDIRDVFERERCLTPRGRATDFWNRFEEDARLARALGCRAFRVSLAWSRLEPDAGRWDDDAFEHYRLVLTTLRAAGLEPFVTLHHNTWPKHVEHRGGMVAPGFPAIFETYAREVAVRLGDLITYYVTINEPNQLVFGYIKPWWSTTYAMPPGLESGADTREQIGRVAQLIPNLFRANALAYDAIHEVYRQAGRKPPAVGTNPLLFGFPAWLQRLVDLNAVLAGRERILAWQGRQLTERRFTETGAADIVIAQLTATTARADDLLFSQAYFVTTLQILTPVSMADRVTRNTTWKGSIAVTRGSPAEPVARRIYPAASICLTDDAYDAHDRLQKGLVDAVIGDEALLRPFVTDVLVLKPVPHAPPQPYVVGIAPGNRELSRAVDRAVGDYVARRPASEGPEFRPYWRRATASSETRHAPDVTIDGVPPAYRSNALDRVKRRKVLRVAVRSGVPSLCERRPDGSYTGVEPELARCIAEAVCGDRRAVSFVEVTTGERMTAVRSPFLRQLDIVLRLIAAFSTILTTNWWYLGQTGKLARSLCPATCVNKFDYVGLDYYWGIRTTNWRQLARFVAASEQRYARAPVWPQVLRRMIRLHADMLPGKPIVIVENGSVDTTDGYSRANYLRCHIHEVQRALADGLPVAGYLCWSITSNREWGLAFDQNSDFGLDHIELDDDPKLTRRSTPAALEYEHIIKSRSAR